MMYVKLLWGGGDFWENTKKLFITLLLLKRYILSQKLFHKYEITLTVDFSRKKSELNKFIPLKRCISSFYFSNFELA